MVDTTDAQVHKLGTIVGVLAGDGLGRGRRGRGRRGRGRMVPENMLYDQV